MITIAALNVNDFSSLLVISGSVSAFVVFILREWISSRLKSSISHEYQIKFESFKQELEYRTKISFLKESKLHEERAQIVRRIYGEMVDAVGTAFILVSHFNLLEQHPEFFEHMKVPKDGDPFKWAQYTKATINRPEENKIADEAKSKISLALSDFKKNKIYFEPEVANEIERFFSLMLFVAARFSDVTFRDGHTFEPVIAKKVIETWKNANEAATAIYPVLEKTFRGYLGISETKNPS